MSGQLHATAALPLDKKKDPIKHLTSTCEEASASLGMVVNKIIAIHTRNRIPVIQQSSLLTISSYPTNNEWMKNISDKS
jgi:hypothetical protein